MDNSRDRFANRCLPLLLANQSGWVLLNPSPFVAVWDGSDSPSGTAIFVREGQLPALATSHFGAGVITWSLPYVFRTSPGWNLLVRGPANWPKDGACALEGIVETDWAVASFTMNWKLTRPGQPVAFAAEEPFAMIVPQRRGDLERIHPHLRPFVATSDFAHDHQSWAAGRAQFLAQLPWLDASDLAWQRHYFQGTSPSGASAREHQTKLRIREFAKDSRVDTE